MPVKHPEHLKKQITKRLNNTMIEFTVEELEMMIQVLSETGPQILQYMELTLYPLTTQFRKRSKKWHHKITFNQTPYPTLLLLTKYRSIYENWDGQEPFPGREVKKIKYYLDK